MGGALVLGTSTDACVLRRSEAFAKVRSAFQVSGPEGAAGTPGGAEAADGASGACVRVCEREGSCACVTHM